MPKDLRPFFAAMMGVQRHLLNILKSKGPEEAAAYASYLTGLSDCDSQTTTQLALPNLTDEDDPAAFLSLFERAALSVHLPEQQWAPALASLLTGDALAGCEEARCIGDGHLTFEDLKAVVLNRTRLAEESCRVRFRSQQGCGQVHGVRTLAQELFQEASGWLKPHSRSGWEVMTCVVMEQFIALLPEFTSIWVQAVRPADLDEAVKLAETHLLLSVDTSVGKVGGETSDVVTSEMVHSSTEINCPPLPQRIPSERASLTMPQASPMKTDDVESFTLCGEPKTEGLSTPDTVHVVQSPTAVDGLLHTSPFLSHHSHILSSSPVSEELQPRHGGHNAGSDTSSESKLSHGEPGGNTSDQWEQQSPELGHLGEEGKGGYVCGKCGKSFLSFQSLHKHQRIHSNHRPFLCADCGFASRTSTGLKRHLVVHSGNRLFPCPDCSESFTYAKRLIHHRTVHANLRPHHCPMCQKSFCLKKALKKHERTHQ
ncbi:hypothetical protein AAFF_G00346210 [Aldrovandia affinis]|uniref:Uncharacterized protein n=1 Tax=Aldrovandia affinis TaxID=143900 RepID=A0AAD7WP15_9TELE|nr:hypothetical protein AAFF_G00346210 [Aldrovandia affinis]